MIYKRLSIGAEGMLISCQMHIWVGEPRWPHTHTLISSMTEWPIFTRCSTADTNHSPGIIWRIQTCLFVRVLNERFILRRWCPNASGARLTHPDASHLGNPVERTQRKMGVLKGSAGLGGLELCAFHTDACAHGEREERGSYLPLTEGICDERRA